MCWDEDIFCPQILCVERFNLHHTCWGDYDNSYTLIMSFMSDNRVGVVTSLEEGTHRLLKTSEAEFGDFGEVQKARRGSSAFSQYTDHDFNLGVVHLNEASLLSCYMNMTNTIIGSGVLGLPYALAHSGSVLGVILIFVSAIAGIFSLHLLSICATKVAPVSS